MHSNRRWQQASQASRCWRNCWLCIIPIYPRNPEVVVLGGRARLPHTEATAAARRTEWARGRGDSHPRLQPPARLLDTLASPTRPGICTQAPCGNRTAWCGIAQSDGCMRAYLAFAPLWYAPQTRQGGRSHPAMGLFARKGVNCAIAAGGVSMGGLRQAPATCAVTGALAVARQGAIRRLCGRAHVDARAGCSAGCV